MFAFAVVNANVFTCNKDRKIRLGYYIYIYIHLNLSTICAVFAFWLVFGRKGAHVTHLEDPGIHKHVHT